MAGSSFQSGALFWQVLPHPNLYWPYPVFGAAIAVLAFYIFGVVRNSN
jgi:hypothetical protein